MRMRIRKRSSCDSGSGYVPWCSTGFCVAITRNGCGSGSVLPSTVTCASFIASSRADCVRGVVRLISSARTTLAKIGPGRNSNSRVSRIVDADAEHVAGQQVRSELDALKSCNETILRAPGRAWSCRRRGRLRSAGGRARASVISDELDRFFLAVDRRARSSAGAA